MIALGRRAGEQAPLTELRRSTPATASDVAASPSVGGARAYRIYLLLTALVYLGLYGGLLVWTDGLPYVMDNNESFSTVWHAQNMATQDIRRSFWLTDESYGSNPEAHPFVHSHQGNFPRLFGFLIYVLGVRSVEAQIVVTTLTIGALAVYFLYHFFSVLAGPRFGFIAALVFMTDYLFFAQWHVVTYRVWHPFFLFASLLCVHGVLRSSRPWRWLALTGVTYLGLFYYELIYVAFVSLLSAFYAVLIGWRRPGRVVGFGLAQGIGGALALTILFAQLAAYLGWSGLRDDLYLTYVARNFAGASADLGTLSPSSVHDFQAMTGQLTAIAPDLQTRLKQFYEQHNLVFWWNLVDSRPLRQPRYFIGSMFVWVFQIYTPFLTLLVGTILAGWAVTVSWNWLTKPRSFTAANGNRTWRATIGRPRLGLRFRVVVEPPLDGWATQPAPDPRWTQLSQVVCWLALVGTTFLLLTTLLRDRAFLGLPLSQASFATQRGWPVALGLLLSVGLAGLMVTRMLTGSWTGGGQLPRVRLLVAALLVLGLTAFIRAQPGLYDQEYAPIWYGRISGQLPLWLTYLSMLLVVALAGALVLSGSRRVLGEGRAATLSGIVPYLLAGCAAYGVTYYLAAGYVLSGYLIRLSPLVVFVSDAAIAVAVGVVVNALLHTIHLVAAWVREARRGTADGMDGRRRRQPLPSVGRRVAAGVPSVALLGAVAGVLLICLSCFWVQTQLAYLSLFPPDRFTFLKMLSWPPYRGASFAVSTYAAPVAHYTQQWAYYDPLISNGDVQLTPSGQVSFARDADTYLWVADKRTNQGYARPDYYACVSSPSFRGILDTINGKEPRTGRCSHIQLAQRASTRNQEFLRFKVVATDPTDADIWTIVKLDWEPLPYLRPLPDDPSGSRVLANLRESPLGRQLAVTYTYAHPDGRPEQASLLKLYRLGDGGSQTPILEVRGSAQLAIPDGLAGPVRVSVTPSSGERSGTEYFSEAVEVPR